MDHLVRFFIWRMVIDFINNYDVVNGSGENRGIIAQFNGVVSGAISWGLFMNDNAQLVWKWYYNNTNVIPATKTLETFILSNLGTILTNNS